MKRGIYLVILVLALMLVGMGASCTKTQTATVSNVSDSTILSDTNGQWAVSAAASSSYNNAVGSDSWSAQQATGAPNVAAYGDNGNAWAPKEKNRGIETLEVTFANPVYATSVRVKESFGSGAITKVELKDVDGNYHVIWTGIDPIKGMSNLQIKFNKTDYLVNAVKITLDTTKAPDEWTEIDSVQLVGTK